MDNGNKTEKKRFWAAIKVLAVNAGVELDDAVLRLYYQALISFSINDIESAVKQVLIEWKWNRMPPLAVILEKINPVQSIEDRALVIANKILAHVQAEGARKFPDLQGDRIAIYLMTKRWPYGRWAANITEAENKWWIRDFCQAYRAHKDVDEQFQIEAPEEVKQIAGDLFKDM